MSEAEKKQATVVDLHLRIRVKHEDYELAYGDGVGDLPDYTTEQASEVVKQQLTRLGWGEVVDVKSSHFTVRLTAGYRDDPEEG